MSYLEEKELIEELEMDGRTVELKNPGMRGMADFLKIARDLSKAGEKATGSEFMNHLTNEAIDSIVRLINMTLEASFPEKWEKDKEELDRWAMQNNTILMAKVIEMCSPKQSSHEEGKVEKLERLRKVVKPDTPDKK